MEGERHRMRQIILLKNYDCPENMCLNVTQFKATLIIQELRRPTRPLKAHRLDEVKAFPCYVLNWRDPLGQSAVKDTT